MLNIQQFTFSPFQENTYVIYDDKGWCAIVDPGCYFDYEKAQLKAFIQDNQLTPKLLLNTHCHLDHVFGNKFTYETWGLIPHLHELELPVLQRAGEAGVKWGVPFDAYSGEVAFVKEGEEVVLGEERLQVLLMPGHSPGSVGFYKEDQEFILSGDVLFRNSIGRTDLPGGDHDSLLNSIRTKLWPLPTKVQVYSGHGPITTIGYEKQYNPYVNEGLF